jgi:peptidoglycan/xylan/chitin deacetylase (PgdA/CDA1 family)
MVPSKKAVLLSFDLEEFDTPIEYGYTIPFSKQLSVSQQGTEAILAILRQFGIKATFFSTVSFATESRELINRLCSDGHELASHSYYHSKFEESDLLKSRLELQKISGQNISGFRMPRMQPVNHQAVANAGYKYDSSLNPTYLPGRYNNFFKPRGLHKKGSIWELPASVTPVARIPLFWLSFHHLPLWFYKLATKASFRPHGYVNIYFHPWEFAELAGKYGLPGIITKATGEKMVTKFTRWLEWMIAKEYSFLTCEELISRHERAISASSL